MDDQMTLPRILEIIASPAVLAGLTVAGIGYGVAFLWSVNVRDCVRLYAIAVVPGLAFLSLLFGLRLVAGAVSPVYPVLIADWLIFSNVAYVSVLARRSIARRRLGSGGKE